jgi:heme oxygenase (biliverdin-producing, ferredoxin)
MMSGLDNGSVVRCQVGVQGGLTALMRKRTREWHIRAERSGIISELLRGRASRWGYALLLRNLLPVYQGMESGLARYRQARGVQEIFFPEVFRAGALESDLCALCQPTWDRWPPYLSAGRLYSRRVSEAADGDGSLLLAHAYVRYLGDLNGGQILRSVLGRSLGLRSEMLSFFDFPAIPDKPAFIASFGEALDRAGHQVQWPDAIAREAAVAFRMNILLSEAVLAAVGRESDASSGTKLAYRRRRRTSRLG